MKITLKDGSVNPRDIKMNLAREIVTLYHGEESAREAEERFKSVFQKGQIPEDIQTIQVKEDGFDLIEVLVVNEIVKSKSEVRRLASQGGVKVNGEKVEDLSTIVKESELVVQIGKKKFVKIELVK